MSINVNKDNNVLLRITSARSTANKVKDLIPDEDGYVTVNLGAYNYKNASGMYYDGSTVEKLIAKGSLFASRLLNGQVKCEVDHPVRRPGETIPEFTQRMYSITMDRVCAIVKEVWIEKTEIPSGRGTDKVIVVKGKVKPFGDKKNVLEEFLNNPDANLCFSVRSTSDRFMEGTTLVKVINSILTWDLINDPGIKIATSWHHLGILKTEDNGDPIDNESMQFVDNDVDEDLCVIRDVDVEKTGPLGECVNCSLESTDLAKIELGRIIKSKMQDRTSGSALDNW